MLPGWGRNRLDDPWALFVGPMSWLLLDAYALRSDFMFRERKFAFLDRLLIVEDLLPLMEVSVAHGEVDS